SSLSVYNDWPGFFALGALLTKAAGLRSAVEFAGWAPVFFNLAFVVGPYLLFRSFTRDRRLLWVAIWLFVLTNWIGQDYFSPQAMSYFFYLVLIGVCVGCFRRRATIAPADAPG